MTDLPFDSKEMQRVEDVLVGCIEVIERNGKINTTFEFELPEAELIWPLLPASIRPPQDLGISVRVSYERAGAPVEFYLLTYDGVVHLFQKFVETFGAEPGKMKEMAARLEKIRLFMQEILDEEKTSRLVFWIPDEIYVQDSGIFLEDPPRSFLAE